MKQAIVILPPKNKQISDIRREYDPNYKKLEPHITVVFPFEIKNSEKLISNVIKGVKPFKLSLSGFAKSKKEYYLYLSVKEGKKDVLSLHRKFYSLRQFKPFLNKGIPYVPHVTIGIFKAKKEIDKALKKIKNKRINLKMKINALQLLNLKKDFTLKSVKNIMLK